VEKGARNVSVRKIDVFQFATTPAQLRRIADGLESQWKECRLGDDVPKIVQYGVAHCELHIVIDQDEMRMTERTKEQET
jgi:hypothetical protein